VSERSDWEEGGYGYLICVVAFLWGILICIIFNRRQSTSMFNDFHTGR